MEGFQAHLTSFLKSHLNNADGPTLSVSLEYHIQSSLLITDNYFHTDTSENLVEF